MYRQIESILDVCKVDGNPSAGVGNLLSRKSQKLQFTKISKLRNNFFIFPTKNSTRINKVF